MWWKRSWPPRARRPKPVDAVACPGDLDATLSLPTASRLCFVCFLGSVKMQMNQPRETSLFDPEPWCDQSLAEHRRILAEALLTELEGEPGVTGTSIQVGPVERPYDLTAVAETDVGPLRTPLWSHARANVFCDASIHPANRRQLAPGFALREAADRLRRRLAVSFTLESRGLTVTMSPEEGVERVWSAERSLFRGRTAVSREDRIAKAGEVDLRDLLAHFYSGPALRLVGEDGTAFLLPAAAEDADGTLISLCHRCKHWSDEPGTDCRHCGGPVDVCSVTRPARR
jgi:hypothetical protein